jgi:hypothetical protein
LAVPGDETAQAHCWWSDGGGVTCILQTRAPGVVRSYAAARTLSSWRSQSAMWFQLAKMRLAASG